ncbi:AMP-binding protein [Aliiruegeria sabulilitoris]|uniref:AMP-binding protein n=1 Tax=Aliiruegeria sabulilitoris TaxID=1510458 RepID=UPI000829959A|nr:AMP-binding protein [Aliiruegeria sabulilitoris]NDR56413.1 AMP-binding protein [Pseudoruegeria sp. M32A2M]
MITTPTYLPLMQGQGWDIPERLNMASEVCDRWAATEPDRMALIEPLREGVRETSYRRLRDMANALAHRLSAMGVGRGDRVGVFLSQSPWTAAAHIAIWKLGAISIPLFTLFGPEAMAVRLEDAEASVVVTDGVGAEKLVNWSQAGDLRLRREQILPAERVPVDGIVFPTVDTAAEDPAVLIYTSGTTGNPKGALHAHRVLRGHLPGVEISHNLMPLPGDVLWTPADWAWIGGLFDVLMPGLWHGVPVVSARMEKFTADECVRIIRQTSVKNVFFPPSALRTLRAADVEILGLRSVASGGEPLGAEILEWGKAAFGLNINEFYGQTECNMVVSACEALFEPRPGAMGKAVPGHELEVIGPDGMPCDGEGDISVKRGSASMMLEYWRNPTATRGKFRGEWMLTGDRGWREGEFLRFQGRDDDVITSSGYRIGPGEVEDCLLTHPAVASAGVVGTPDPERTEAVTAFVLLRDGIEPTDEMRAGLQQHVRQRLAAHEYPRIVHFVESLPMTISGKIIRRELRQMALIKWH